MTSRMRASRTRALVVVLVGATVLAAPMAAQGLDRSKAPTVPKTPTLRVPRWTKTTLPNGAMLIVVPKHDLPLVAFNLDFVGGSANFEPADKTGVAGFTGAMLSEGTTTKTAEQLSDAQQLLGTSIVASIGLEDGTIRFASLRNKFEPALALLVDVLLNSTFPDSALERIRARTLVALTQQRDQPATIAANVFARTTYGTEHPYGRVISEASVKAITRNDVASFAKAYFTPAHAVITVSGDIDEVAAKSAVERAFRAWPKGGARPSFDYPPVPASRSRMIYLVDKPKAAQSIFALGAPGPSRSTPDFYALSVMNRLLGGSIQSRLSHDIREVKGYSYGVRSSFAYGHGPGPFNAGGAIVSAKSDSALMAFMTHFNDVRGAKPFTDDELAEGKQGLIQSLPSRFSSVNAVATAISSLYTQDLPETYFADYASKINAVSKDDLTRVAKKYIDVDHMNLVIVGDRASIEGPLKATGIAPIQILDVEGHPVLVP